MPTPWPARMRAAAIAAICLLFAHAAPARAAEFVARAEVAAKDAKQILADWGIGFSATYIGEALGNASGGIRRGAIYTGRLDLGTDVDLERLMGWSGATFHANIYQIHGDGLSRDYIGNLMLVSGIEALPATRLYEMWIEQSLWGGRLMIKVGQQPSDIEFIDSKYDDVFANSALGWPGITGVILPSGGPSPPLAVPGIRLKAQLTERLTAYFAVFDGDAAPAGPQDPQIKNPHGLLFRVNDPPWFIGQLKYGFELGAASLPGSITGGAWYHMGTFDDQRLTAQGLSQADPAGSGEPANLRRNQGIFAVYEQKLAHSALDPQKGIGFFARASVSPSDRNLVSVYIDGGVQVTGFSERRPNDKIGAAITYARISDGARQFDRDIREFTGIATPVRDFEAIVELTYLAEVKPGVLVQPLFQYVMHPGGGAVDPNDPAQTRRIKDAAVFGVRTTINF
ncbi:carbohydrate porin [Tardiphaga sp.]|uniref:carbohydrate porin n=1 Tax=Tardiphaga sp. TaxID=1926292 RepID=UPI002610851E|nr:carbohydrate porin [Tardiphaga sp.]